MALYNVRFLAATNADLRETFSLADDTGAAIALTGASLEMTIRLGAGELVCTNENGRIVVPDADGNIFALAIARADLAALGAGTGQHDLLLTKAGTTTRVWTGAFVIDQGITAP